jgi:rhamnose utilization protein RhaD (predicted bifunctional aldolase and dehydrogenase)
MRIRRGRGNSLPAEETPSDARVEPIAAQFRILEAMVMAPKRIEELVRMSQRLGEPAKEYLILGEGNTSAQCDDESFWVKASGMELATIGEEGFCLLYFKPVLDMLMSQEPLSDDAIKESLAAATVHACLVRPSVETVLHAQLLNLPDVHFVAHTHPHAVLSLLCSKGVKEAIAGRVFPDEIVACGIAPVFIPYVDPGLPLAQAVHEGVHEFIDTYGERPKAILMQNHGLIALGENPKECESVTAMWVKTARVLLGTAAFGGPNFLSPDHVKRIHTRPDEEYRRKMIEGAS